MCFHKTTSRTIPRHNTVIPLTHKEISYPPTVVDNPHTILSKCAIATTVNAMGMAVKYHLLFFMLPAYVSLLIVVNIVCE